MDQNEVKDVVSAMVSFISSRTGLLPGAGFWIVGQANFLSTPSIRSSMLIEDFLSPQVDNDSELKYDINYGRDEWTVKLTSTVHSATIRFMLVTDHESSLLKRLVQAGIEKLIIDLTEVETIDANGLRRLLRAKREFVEAGIQIILKNPNPHLKRLLRIMGFDRTFIIEPDD